MLPALVPPNSGQPWITFQIPPPFIVLLSLHTQKALLQKEGTGPWEEATEECPALTMESPKSHIDRVTASCLRGSRVEQER